MKHLKKYESKFKVVKSSDLDNWSVDNLLNKEKDDKLTGRKKLDLKVGREVEKLFEDYGVTMGVGPGDWMKNQSLILKSEEQFKEYRVSLDSKKDYEELSDFSVFLPVTKQDTLRHAALAEASSYLKIINECVPDMINGKYLIDDALGDYTEGFKTFLKRKDLKITNKNVEDVLTVKHRLYKDSKFFYAVYYNFKEAKNFFSDWVKLIS